jgi:hypothetical protein
VISNRNQHLIPSFQSIDIYHRCMPLSESPSTIVTVPYQNQHQHLPSLHAIIGIAINHHSSPLSESTSTSTIIACYYWNLHLLTLQSLIGINIGIYHHCMLLSELASTMVAVPYQNQHILPSFVGSRSNQLLPKSESTPYTIIPIDRHLPSL